MKRELYFSTDIESDGPIPGRNSMLSFATVVLDVDGNEHGSFSRNLELWDGARPDPDTAKWWEGQPEAWAACRKDLVKPFEAMADYVEWVNGFSGMKAFVGYPTGFDFMFMYWYIRACGLESPFSFSALDIKTFAMAFLRTNFRESVKRNYPRRWFPSLPHTHVALDDAREQGFLAVNMLRESRGLPCLGPEDMKVLLTKEVIES